MCVMIFAMGSAYHDGTSLRASSVPHAGIQTATYEPIDRVEVAELRIVVRWNAAGAPDCARFANVYPSGQSAVLATQSGYKLRNDPKRPENRRGNSELLRVVAK